MKMKATLALGALAAMLLTSVGCQSYGEDRDEDATVQLTDLPQAVRATAEKHAAGARIIDVGVELEDGATVYEVETRKDGKTIEIRIAPDGKFLGSEIDDDEEDDGDDD